MLMLLVIIGILAFWVVSVQRQLVNADELCKNAMSQIGVQQNSRWDALTALADLIKSYNEHEYKTLMEVIGQRAKVGRNSTPEEVTAQETKIADTLKQINFVAEQYPDLKANDMYNKTMDSLNTYENQVRLSRMTYNDSITKLNRLVRQIPNSFIAGFLGFTEKEYLEEPAGKTEMPSMKI